MWIVLVGAGMQWRWLIEHNKKGLGRLQSEVVTGEQLERRLSTDQWKISITGVEQLSATWKLSSTAAVITLHLTQTIKRDT